MSVHRAQVCWMLVETAAKTAHLAHALKTLYQEVPEVSHGVITFDTFVALYVLIDLTLQLARWLVCKRIVARVPTSPVDALPDSEPIKVSGEAVKSNEV